MPPSFLRLSLACLGSVFCAAFAFAQAPPPGATSNHYLLGTEYGGNTAVFNRFQWWDKVPPSRGQITGPFESEFCPPLARVVGDPTGAPAGFTVASWVGWQSFYFFTSTLEFVTRNDRPRSEPDFVRLTPDPARPALTALVNRYTGPLPLTLTGNNIRPSLFLDFERGQRAVGLEYGFVPLPDSTREFMASSAVHLLAFDREGRFVTEAFGGGPSIRRTNLANRIGVRSERGDIFSVELRFERGSGDNIVDQQAILRVWHEPLPLAAVKQGAVAVGSFNPAAGTREGPVLLGAVQERLPFNCDRAVILLRGFWLKYHDDASHDVGEVKVGFVAFDTMRQTTPGGSVSWVPAASFMRPLDGTPSAPTDAILYYTVLAWDSQQAELLPTFASGASSGNGDRAFVNLQVPDPLGGRVGFGASSDPATWRTQTEAARGHLFAGLSNFWFTADQDHDDIAEFRLGVGGYQVSGFQELFWNPAGPAGGALFRNLLWPSVALWTGDGSDAYQVSLGGTLLAGRSLRSAADSSASPDYSSFWTQGGFVTPTTRVNGRPAFSQIGAAPYWNPGWRDLRAHHLSFPLPGEVAAVGLYEFAFAPGDPFREIEVEVHGANYDGRVIDWQQGRGTITNTLGSGPHDVIVLPCFASVRRNADFATARLQTVQFAVTDATYAKPWVGGGSSVVTPGIVRNSGDADLLITDFAPATNRPQDQRFFMTGVVWRGQTLSAADFAARRPLQLRAGEELQILVGYSADRALRRDGAPMQETGVMSVLTNGSPNIGTTLPMTANVHADLARGALIAKDKNGTYASYDFGRQKDLSGVILSVSAVLSDVGGTPLTVQSVSIQTPNIGYDVTTPNGLNPQPVPGQPNAPPQVEYKVTYTLGKGRFGVQKTDLVVDTNAGRFKLPLRVEVVP